MELVTNVIPGYNDDEGELTAIAHWIRESLGADVPWHLTRFYPHLDLSHLPPTPTPTLERARQVRRHHTSQPVSLSFTGSPGGSSFVYISVVYIS